MLEQRIIIDDGIEEAKRRVDGGSEEYEAIGAFALKDQCLLGAYMWGEIAFGVPNLRGWSYRLCARATTTVIIVTLVGAGPAL